MIHLLDHPLIQDRLAQLRSVDCPSGEFRQHIGQIARLMENGYIRPGLGNAGDRIFGTS
jgi:uracil phosphoribosyltransferase